MMPVVLDRDATRTRGYVRHDDGRSSYMLHPDGPTNGHFNFLNGSVLKVMMGSPVSGPVC